MIPPSAIFACYRLLSSPSYITYQAAPSILLFFERHLDTHFGLILWIALSYDVTMNDTHDSNGRPLLRIAL